MVRKVITKSKINLHSLRLRRIESKTSLHSDERKQVEKNKQSLSSRKLESKQSLHSRKLTKSKTSLHFADAKRKQSLHFAGAKSSLSVDLYDVKGEVVGKTTLPIFAFGTRVNPDLIAQAVRVYAVNQRRGTANTKSRGEVSGGGKKPWRQKGTGKARQGSIRSPIWVGGGIAHGPKAKIYELKLSKKMRRQALFSTLTEKARGGKVKVVDGLEKMEPKTKNMAALLSKLSTGNGVLLILPKKIENVEKASRNIEGLTISNISNMNVYDVLKNSNLIFLKESLEVAKEVWK